jgi:tetratricopeptide (TPR) repeat protein
VGKKGKGMAKLAFIISLVMAAFLVAVTGIVYISYPDYHNPIASIFITMIQKEVMFWIFYTTFTTIIIVGIAGWIENRNKQAVFGILIAIGLFFVFPGVQHLSFVKSAHNPVAYSNVSELWSLRGEFDGSIRDYSASINLDPNDASTYLYRAKVYNRVGLYNQAIADYNKAIQLDSESAAAYRNRGFYYVGQNQLDQAIADLNKATEMDKGYSAAYCDLGIAYFRLSNFDSAISNLNQSVALNPNQIRAYYALGTLYNEKKDKEKSIANFNKASNCDSKYALAFMQNLSVAEPFYCDVFGIDKSLISDFSNNDFVSLYSDNPNSGNVYYVPKRQIGVSLASLSEAIISNPDYAANYYNRSLYYVNNGLFDLAKADLDRAIEIDPDYFMAYNNRGTLFSGWGDYDQALTDFNMAIAQYPNLSTGYYNRALCYDALGDNKAASSDMKKAIQYSESEYFTSTAKSQLELITNTGTDHTTWLKERGDTLLSYGKYDRAIEYYGQAIADWPDSYTTAYFGRAVAYHKKGQNDLAIADLNKAIEVKPKNKTTGYYANPYYELGHIYLDIGDNNLAILNLNKAIDQQANCSRAYYYRGLFYIKAGNLSSAVQDLQKAMDTESTIALTSYESTQTLFETVPAEYTVEEISSITSYLPNNPQVYAVRGLAHYSNREYDLAIEDWNKALVLDPALATVYNNRCVVYIQQGQFDKAFEDVSMAIKLKPEFSQAFYNRGILYSIQGKNSLAVSDLRKTTSFEYRSSLSNTLKLSIDYTISEIQPDMSYQNNRYSQHINKEEFDLSAAQCTGWIMRNPESAEAYYDRGESYLKLNLNEQAIMDFNKALELSKDPLLTQDVNKRLSQFGK